MEAAVFTLTLFLLLTVTNRDDVSFTEIFLPYICGTVTSKHSEGFYRSSGRERSPAGFLEVPLHRRSDRRHQDFHHSPENCGKYIIHNLILSCISLFGETQLPNTSSKILEINPFILISLTMITVWLVY